jgi:ABC-type multidrug transport system fused ATPase/permease subunit
MTIGTLVAFLAYQQRLFAPIQGLLGLSATLAQTRVALARIFELMDTKPEVDEAQNPHPLNAITRGFGLNMSRCRTVAIRCFATPISSFRRAPLRDPWAKRGGQVDHGGSDGAYDRSRWRAGVD